ncbi:Ig-like domain-containing protein [Vibrio chagasii]|uniref:Ig-like domain-containing protein n=1 Tax=Vibrio chagasii TaxID=170679 RepID=UPI003DA0A033
MNIINNKSGGGIPLGFVVATTLTLFGCGGEGGEGSAGSSTSVSSNTQSATLSAQNATYSTGYVETFEVDLSSKVFSSTGGGFTLSEVEVLSNNDGCQVESTTETGFVIKATETKVCDYLYHVSPTTTLAPMSDSTPQTPMAMADVSIEGSSSAITRVAVSSEPEMTELVPISSTTLINEGVDVSLKAELDKVGFTLSDGFVLTDLTLPYARGSTAHINTLDDQVIEYNPPNGFTGIDRVLYTLEDSANGLVLMGVWDIAVGYEANQGFTVSDNIEYPGTVNVFSNVEIDISDFVSSDDGDDFQLVYVESFNAQVESKSPLDTDNKTIIFQASTPGYHYVSFAVSDHNGAYDMGLIRIEVIDPNQSGKWGDISHLADLYTGPPTAWDASGEGIPYDMKLTDAAYSPVIDMAGFRYSSAVVYCDRMGGALPTVDQLTQMSKDINVQALHNWPAQAQYLAYDEVVEQPIWVDMTDGVNSSGAVDPTSAYYLTCIKQGLIDVLPTSSSIVVADGVDTGSVFVELKLGSEVMSNKLITASVSSPYVTLDSDIVTTDSDGLAEFHLTSLKAELVTLTLESEGISQGYDLKFIADEKTAAVTSDTTIDGASYSSVEGNQVTSKLTDQNGNPVEGYTVIYDVNAHVDPVTGMALMPLIEKEASETDKFGEQKVRVKWDPNNATPTAPVTFDITSSYITSTFTQTDSVSKVTFYGYVCGNQIGDRDPTNAGDACVKLAESNGKLFTGSPSTGFVNTLEGMGDGDTEGYVSETTIGAQIHTFTVINAKHLCENYNLIKLNGRENWHMPTQAELNTLRLDNGGNMKALGWPTSDFYWASDLKYGGLHNAIIRLSDGHATSAASNSGVNPNYASCVSDF